MNTNITTGATTVVIALFAAVPAVGQPGPDKKVLHAKVTLIPAVEAVVPGRPFDVGLRFELTKGWHIYWKNSGDSGLPPKVTWSLPDGFSAGDFRYPVPKRHHSFGDIVTNILDRDPILLTTVTPAQEIATDRVTLKASVFYLICSTKCLPEETDVQLELPVLQQGSEPAPTNDELFHRARQALPKQSSEYLSVTASTEPSVLSPGQSFELLLNIEINPGYRIHSNEPLDNKFTALDAFVEPAEGVSFGHPVYPPPEIGAVEEVGTLSEYIGSITLRIPGAVDAEAPTGPRRLRGLMTYEAMGANDNRLCPEALAFAVGESGMDVVAEPPAAIAAQAEAVADTPTSLPGRFGVIGMFVACFLYGLFINATPCVLPVLSIKVLGFVQQAHESRRRTLVLGLAFGAGVMLLFVILGFLASSGRNILQYPAAVIGLGAIVMALSLSMLGIYTLQAPTTATRLEDRFSKEGILSSFGKGALAPILGFACTGPLLAGAFAWATQQPPYVAIFAFLFAGLGMASPYILLGANPNWLSFVPKPGQWMVTFERVMGFLLLAMVIWLLNPLVTQIGASGLQWTFVFLVAVAMACWLLGRIEMTMPVLQRWRYRIGAAATVIAAGVVIYGLIQPLGAAQARQQVVRMASYGGDDTSSGIPWQSWSEEAVEREARSGRMVFVDFTAAWCTVCKVNKKMATDTPEVRDKLKSLGIVPFQADFTSRDPKIAAALQKYGRAAGPPLNLIYPAGRPDGPIVLRPILTKAYLLEKLDEAAGSARTAAAGARGS